MSTTGRIFLLSLSLFFCFSSYADYRVPDPLLQTKIQQLYSRNVPSVVITPENYVQKLQSISLANGAQIVFRGEWRNIRLDIQGNGLLLRPALEGSTFTGSSRLTVTGDGNVVSKLKFVGGMFEPGSSDSAGNIKTQQSSNYLIRLGDNSTNRPCNRCTLIDVEVTNVGTQPIDRTVSEYTMGFYLSVYGVDSTIAFNTFQGMHDRGHMIEATNVPPDSPTQGLIIYRNKFLNRTWSKEVIAQGTVIANGHETIQLGGLNYSAPLQSFYGKDLYSVIQENEFTDCEPDMSLITLKAGRVKIVGNTFTRPGGPILFRSANNVTVTGNVFEGNYANGISAGGLAISGKGHEITGNTFKNNGSTTLRPIKLFNGQAEELVLDAVAKSDAEDRGIPRAKDIVISGNDFQGNIQSVDWALGYGTGADPSSTTALSLGFHLVPQNITFTGNTFSYTAATRALVQFVLPSSLADFLFWGIDDTLWKSGDSSTGRTTKFENNYFLCGPKDLTCRDGFSDSKVSKQTIDSVKLVNKYMYCSSVTENVKVDLGNGLSKTCTRIIENGVTDYVWL